MHVCLTPQYLLSLNICGGRGFPVAGLDSSGTFSLIHFLLPSCAAMSHSSNSILFAARKPFTSCCCFFICVRGRRKRVTRGKLSVRQVFTFRLMRKHKALCSPYCHRSAAKKWEMVACRSVTKLPPVYWEVNEVIQPDNWQRWTRARLSRDA